MQLNSATSLATPANWRHGEPATRIESNSETLKRPTAFIVGRLGSGRMVAKKVLGKLRSFRTDPARLRPGEAGCIRLACSLKWMQACSPPRGKIFVHIALLDEGHGTFGRSVASLNGARLERSLECRRREEETPTITLSLRAFQRSCRDSSKSLKSGARRACKREGRSSTLLRERPLFLFNIALKLQLGPELYLPRCRRGRRHHARRR